MYLAVDNLLPTFSSPLSSFFCVVVRNSLAFSGLELYSECFALPPVVVVDVDVVGDRTLCRLLSSFSSLSSLSSFSFFLAGGNGFIGDCNRDTSPALLVVNFSSFSSSFSHDDDDPEDDPERVPNQTSISLSLARSLARSLFVSLVRAPHRAFSMLFLERSGAKESVVFARLFFVQLFRLDFIIILTSSPFFLFLFFEKKNKKRAALCLEQVLISTSIKLVPYRTCQLDVDYEDHHFVRVCVGRRRTTTTARNHDDDDGCSRVVVETS